MHLATEGVEVVCWCRWVNKLPVAILYLPGLWVHLIGWHGHPWVLIAKGQEAFNVGVAVFRAGTIVAVGQEHGDVGPLEPLFLPASNELVNDGLGRIGKITELGFPKGQVPRGYHGVAQFKAKDSVLTQGAVADLEGGLLGINVVKGNPLLLNFLVMEHRVSLTKRSSLHILKVRYKIRCSCKRYTWPEKRI